MVLGVSSLTASPMPCGVYCPTAAAAVCCCSATKFLQVSAELTTWSTRTAALRAIQISFSDSNTPSNLRSSQDGNGNTAIGRPRNSLDGIGSGSVNGRGSQDGTGKAAAGAALMVRLNLKGSKLMGLLEGWLAAAERDRHISFVKQLLQVKGGRGGWCLGAFCVILSVCQAVMSCFRYWLAGKRRCWDP
jgi:hypothetical protein